MCPQQLCNVANSGGPDDNFALVYGLDAVPCHLLLWFIQDRGSDATDHHLGRHIREDQCRLQSHCLWHKASVQITHTGYYIYKSFSFFPSVSHPKYRLVLKEKVVLIVIQLFICQLSLFPPIQSVPYAFVAIRMNQSQMRPLQTRKPPQRRNPRPKSRGNFMQLPRKGTKIKEKKNIKIMQLSANDTKM